MKRLATAETVMQRINALGRISEEPGRLTRTYGSSAMRRANELVGSWMRRAGMTVRQDALGNLIGNYPGSATAGRRGMKSRPVGSASQNSPKILLLGSHLDTVRDAGKFDGPLGVLAGIACVQRLFQDKVRLPFAIEVIGFADEEGVRYQSAYLGSRALAGGLSRADLQRTDAQGVTLARAIRNFGGNPAALGSARLAPHRLLGYAEVHIEQGPVLEQQGLALGVVKTIAGQTRAAVRFNGQAGHAGTTPMSLRRDALCAAAEFILLAESLARRRAGLVATVGEMAALPGASNVIPGEVRLSVDVRHPNDAARRKAVAELRIRAVASAARRGVRLDWRIVHETAAVRCDARLTALMGRAVKRHQSELVWLHSGAGHDAAALAAITPVTMLFVRCKGGLSHHPAESASVHDVRVALAVMNDFIAGLARQQG